MRKLSIVNHNPNEEIADKKRFQYSPMLNAIQQTPLKALEIHDENFKPETYPSNDGFSGFQPHADTIHSLTEALSSKDIASMMNIGIERFQQNINEVEKRIEDMESDDDESMASVSDSRSTVSRVSKKSKNIQKHHSGES